MNLPAITLPQINLPFDIPTLLHPAVVHFVIAIPVIVLLLEFYNLFTRRRSIGAFSFILLLITVAMLAMAYLTGGVDGKEAFDLLSSDGQAELKSHKLLGTYVLFTAVAVVIFKLLAMTGKGFFRVLYFLMLIGLIAITLKQGKDGGELVYEYGANVERVEALTDNLSDAKDEIIEMSENKNKAENVEAKEAEVNATKIREEAVSVSTEATASTKVEEPKVEVSVESAEVPTQTVDTDPAVSNEPIADHVEPTEVELQDAIKEVNESL
jgi:uncharacterized membrane protein